MALAQLPHLFSITALLATMHPFLQTPKATTASMSPAPRCRIAPRRTLDLLRPISNSLPSSTLSKPSSISLNIANPHHRLLRRNTREPHKPHPKGHLRVPI